MEIAQESRMSGAVSPCRVFIYGVENLPASRAATEREAAAKGGEVPRRLCLDRSGRSIRPGPIDRKAKTSPRRFFLISPGLRRGRK
jgi:hypothetical protein